MAYNLTTSQTSEEEFSYLANNEKRRDLEEAFSSIKSVKISEKPVNRGPANLEYSSFLNLENPYHELISIKLKAQILGDGAGAQKSDELMREFEISNHILKEDQLKKILIQGDFKLYQQEQEFLINDFKILNPHEVVNLLEYLLTKIIMQFKESSESSKLFERYLKLYVEQLQELNMSQKERLDKLASMTPSDELKEIILLYVSEED